MAASPSGFSLSYAEISETHEVLPARACDNRHMPRRVLIVTPKTVETHIRHIFAKLRLPESALDNKRVHAVLAYLRA